ncbi:MAG: hypothetical protein J0H07_19765 [Sphingobacteriales bacterium]|nr:hypothetical protein [Sphingobacteriales bacterium]
MNNNFYKDNDQPAARSVQFGVLGIEDAGGCPEISLELLSTSSAAWAWLFFCGKETDHTIAEQYPLPLL